jgi:hypothetical protein
MVGDKITLVDELIGPNFGLNGAEAIQLESKKEMRKRGVPSPNVADALACTFAFPVYIMRSAAEEIPMLVISEYDPFEQKRIYANA